jgi:hypothetical protein
MQAKQGLTSSSAQRNKKIEKTEEKANETNGQEASGTTTTEEKKRLHKNTITKKRFVTVTWSKGEKQRL